MHKVNVELKLVRTHVVGQCITKTLKETGTNLLDVPHLKEKLWRNSHRQTNKPKKKS